MDLRKLKTLIDLVSDSNVSELEITEAEGTVRIVKAQPQPIIQYAQMPAPLGSQFASQAPMQYAAPQAMLTRPGGSASQPTCCAASNTVRASHRSCGTSMRTR